jgi:hypothetical protein
MGKVYSKTSLKDNQSHLEYWLIQIPQEKLYALVVLNKQQIGFNKNVQLRFKSVVTKTTLKK